MYYSYSILYRYGLLPNVYRLCFNSSVFMGKSITRAVNLNLAIEKLETYNYAFGKMFLKYHRIWKFQSGFKPVL